MPTIKDVAKKSGYSVSTVSYALSNHPKIPEATKETIRKVALELGYHPNFFAKSLKTKTKKNIAIFLPGFQGPVHPLILSGIDKAIFSSDNQYNLVVTLSRNGYNLIYDGFVDVAFVLSPVISDEEVEKISLICPIILLDKIYNGKNVYNTLIHNEEGIYERVIDFYHKGQRKFIFLSGSPMSKHNIDRKQGFLKAINELKINKDDYRIIECSGYTERHGYKFLKEYLEHNHFQFDAIIGSNDELAIGAIQYLNELNIRIPEDVKVSGFDNIDKGKYINPPLSTISPDWEQYGIEVGNLMNALLKGEERIDAIEVSTTLINRISG